MKKYSTGNPLATLFYIFIVCTVSMLIVTACRKIDNINTVAEKEKINVENFFTAHQSANPAIIAAQQFVKNQNAKYHFVENLVRKIGLPYWDKSLASPNRNTGNSPRTESVGDSNTVVYVPFVAEGEDDVSTSLVIKMTPSDTLFKFIYDWQYHDTSINGGDRLKLPLLLMSLSNSLFGNRMFKIMDSTAFPVTGGRADYVKLDPISTANRTGVTTETIWEYTLTLCYTWWEFDPWVVGCEPGGPCNPGRSVSACHTIQWEYDDGMGSGGNGGGGNNGGGSGGGNGSGGNWEPEQECIDDINTPENECPDPFIPVNLVSANQSIIDSLQGYPCAQAILAQLPGINSQLTKLLDSVFNIADNADIYFKPKSGFTIDSIDGYADTILSGSPSFFRTSIYINPWVMENSTNEYIAGVFVHEAIHAYINSIFFKYRINAGGIDSNYLKLHFPIFWDHQNNLNSTTPTAQHNEMAAKYVSMMKDFLKILTPAISDSMAEAIAWGGLHETNVWKARSDTNTIRNLNRIARRDQSSTNTQYSLYGLKKCI